MNSIDYVFGKKKRAVKEISHFDSKPLTEFKKYTDIYGGVAFVSDVAMVVWFTPVSIERRYAVMFLSSISSVSLAESASAIVTIRTPFTKPKL